MGRPGTPGPEERGGGGDNSNKATFSATLVLLGIISFILGVIAVAVPYWGHFRPQYAASGAVYNNYGTSYQDNSGFFGPFNKCMYTHSGYRKICGNSNVRYGVEVYMKIAGVCGIVAVLCMALFCVFSGLHCAMQINNKHIGLKYKKNVFLAFMSALVADISTIAAVGIAAPQFTSRRQEYRSELGACYYIEIVLVVFNLLLAILSYLSYKKARKTNFPKSRDPYEITPEQYGNDNLAGPHHGRGGITVTANSGVHYTNNQPAHDQHLQAQLPAFPAPAQHTNGYYQPSNGQMTGMVTQMGQMTGQLAQPQMPYTQPVAAVAPQQRFVPQRVESPMGVNLNPGGRSGGAKLGGPGVGSMDSLNSTQDSVLSFGSTISTGSYNSAASINNPMRSSLKKPKNKETASMISNASGKKSVRIALGEEQTAV